MGFTVANDSGFNNSDNKRHIKKEMNNSRQLLLTVIVVFIVTSALTLIFKSTLVQQGFSFPLLFYGNLLLFLMALATASVQLKGVTSSSNQVFFRSVYLSMMAKMFICAIAVIIYASAVDGPVNKRSLLSCMALYIVYTAIEVRTLTKALRRGNG
jgi:magnesium-transporting ATPase (P-type)